MENEYPKGLIVGYTDSTDSPLYEVIGYKNVKGVLYLKLKDIRTDKLTTHPYMFGTKLTKFGKKEVVKLLYV
jgi:hypothetical protein